MDPSERSADSPEKAMPKRVQKVLDRLSKEGEEPVHAFPGIPQSYRDESQMAFARIGVVEKANTWIIVTRKRMLFVRVGLVKNYERSIPLDSITDIEYVDEYHNNTLKIKVGERAEQIIFFEDADGIKLYRYVKNRQCQTS
jgi:hypothetical protein